MHIRNSVTSRLPNEVLEEIIRLATLSSSHELGCTFSDPFELATYRFSDEYWGSDSIYTKLSVVRVSKQWYHLGTRFLYEHIGISPYTIEMLLELISDDIGGIKRGWWTKRIDLHSQLAPWFYEEYFGESLKELFKYTPNLTIFSIAVAPSRNTQVTEWITEVTFDLGSFKNLQRLEWSGFQEFHDIQEFQMLSHLCPNLVHIAIRLATDGDEESYPDAGTISFPKLKVLILDWVPDPNLTFLNSPFGGWDLPSLEHFTYFLHLPGDPILMITNILKSVGSHLKSLELPTPGWNDTFSFLSTILPLVPALETLIIDVFRVHYDWVQSSHSSLRILGWRLRRTRATLYDLVKLQECAETFFDKQAFPALELVRVVHPDDFRQYSWNMTPPLVDFWNDMCSRIPIVTFDKIPASIT